MIAKNRLQGKTTSRITNWPTMQRHPIHVKYAINLSKQTNILKNIRLDTARERNSIVVTVMLSSAIHEIWKNTNQVYTLSRKCFFALNAQNHIRPKEACQNTRRFVTQKIGHCRIRKNALCYKLNRNNISKSPITPLKISRFYYFWIENKKNQPKENSEHKNGRMVLKLIVLLFVPQVGPPPPFG